MGTPRPCERGRKALSSCRCHSNLLNISQSRHYVQINGTLKSFHSTCQSYSATRCLAFVNTLSFQRFGGDSRSDPRCTGRVRGIRMDVELAADDLVSALKYSEETVRAAKIPCRTSRHITNDFPMDLDVVLVPPLLHLQLIHPYLVCAPRNDIANYYGRSLSQLQLPS